MSVNQPQQWLDKATEDLSVARLVLTQRYYSHTCFLSQQSVEKALKAFLLKRTNTYPRVHKLADLLTQCIALDKTFAPLVSSCVTLDQFYIPTRYPDSLPDQSPSSLPGEAEAKESLTVAEDVLAFVTRLI